jgi:hypothetical protein
MKFRGYIYWRLICHDPELARELILGEKPRISDDSGVIEESLLEILCSHIGMLSSVYYKTPEAFVQKIRQKENERFDLENVDDIEENEYIDSATGKKLDAESIIPEAKEEEIESIK